MSVKKQKDDLAYDEVQILNVSQRIVENALQPFALADYILDHVDAEDDLVTLRIAINSRYPEFRERYEKGERGEVETEIHIIDELVKFHVGVAVGRRVR